MEQTEQRAILSNFCQRQINTYLDVISKQEKQPESGPALVYDFIGYIDAKGDYEE